MTARDAFTERRVLLVDDDPVLLALLARQLAGRGFVVQPAASGTEALDAVGRSPIDAAVLDHSLPDTNGVALLRRLRAIDPTMAVIMLSGTIDVPETVRALREGAEDVQTKPADIDLLEAALSRGLQRTAMSRAQSVMAAHLADPFGLLDESGPMRRALQIVQHAATRDLPILFAGPAGSGKRALAEMAHRLSPHRERPFISVAMRGRADGDAAAALDRAVEQVRGAGAAAIPTGTVYLDDLASVGPATQRRLAPLLDPRRAEIEQVAPVQLRIMSAVRDIALLHRLSGQMPTSLRDRLSLVTVHVPSLSERGADAIIALAQRVVDRLRLESGEGPAALTAAAATWVACAPWRGNVPQLRTLLGDAFVQAAGAREIDVPHLEAAARTEAAPHDAAPTLDAPPPDWSLRSMERRQIAAVLAHTNDQRSQAARLLGITRTTLYKKMADYGIGTAE